jgi:hypothetical protein
MMGFPTVNLNAVEGFLKVYNSGGLYLLFDAKSKQAMVDFANTALRSYVIGLQEQAAKLIAAKKAVADTLGNNCSMPPAPVQKSLITLTDV